MVSTFISFTKKHLLLTVLCLLCFTVTKTYATHIIGGEITYKCLDNGDYEITLDVFRDCFYGVADFDSLARIAIFDATTMRTLEKVPPLFIDTLSNDLDDPCVELPDDVCVEWARYRTVVNLPPSDFDYTIVHQRCCRNNTIANIIDPEETGATFFVKITPEGYNACNSSPSFVDSGGTGANYPPVAICVGKPIVFDQSATDVDGDSLVYKMCTPFEGATLAIPNPFVPSPPPYDNINWLSPYDEDNMLGGNIDALSIDPVTGLLNGFPQIQGQFVVGVCVEEYRDGVLLSTVRRDFQYNVTMCVETIADFDIPEAQCDDLEVAPENNSISSVAYQWNFLDNGNVIGISTVEDPEFNFPDTGTYEIMLVANPGESCADTLVKSIFLQNNSIEPGFDFTAFNCEDSSVIAITSTTIDPVSPIIGYQWTISYNGLQQTSTAVNPNFVVPNPSSGTIEMIATSQNGCVISFSQPFDTDGDNPLNEIDLNPMACQSEIIQLNPTEAGAGLFNFNWGPPINSTQINPSVIATTDMTYPVTITATNGLCSSTASIELTVVDLPNLNFDFNSDCDGTTVNFNNQSTNAQDYIWDFGDGSQPVTAVNPTHVFPNVGSYDVTLKTGPNTFCPDSITVPVVLPEKILIADFDFAYSDCNKDEVAIQFTNTSVNSLSNTVELSWTFSNGQTSAQQNPTVILTNEQTLQVTLTITTAEGCTDTKTESLEVDFIEFNFTDSLLSCYNEPVELNPNFNPDYIYLWTPATGLDDPTKPNPIANPQSTIVYTVFITNISADTCELSQTVEVVVPEPINLQVSDDIMTCESLATLVATTDLGNIDFEWTDQSGNVVGNTATIVVNVSGSNVYTVTASDAFGCQETGMVAVTGGTVNVEIGDDQIICTDEEANISILNLDPNDNLSIEWTPASAFVGDPTDNPNPELIIQPGEQTIGVTVTNQFGCTTTDSVFVAIIDENINLDFDFQIGCSGSEVTFTNLSTNAFGYVWDFGTGDTSNEVNPIYSFPGIGNYTVTLDIIYDVDCAESIQKVVEIVEPDFIPDFEFDFENCTTDGTNIQFFDTSINFLNNTNSWFWDFGNGMTSTDQNPFIVIAEDTQLTVTLTIGTANDCSGSTTQTLNIDVTESNVQEELTLCLGDTVGLNQGGNPNYEYVWSPAAGLSDSTSASPLAFPTQSTTYAVTITNVSADTCTLIQEVMVEVPTPIDVTIFGDTITCGSPILLTASSNIDPNVNYEWFTIGGNLLDTGNELSVNPLTSTTYILQGTDLFGCVASDTITVSNEAIELEVDLDGTSVCPNDTVIITAVNLNANQMVDLTWTAVAPAQIIDNNTGTSVTILSGAANDVTTVFIQSENQFGCEKTDTISINNFNFVPTIADDQFACPNELIELNHGANPALDYVWNSPLIVPDNQPNPIISLMESEVFGLTVSQTFGNTTCSVTDEIAVTVTPVIGVGIVGESTTCGEPIELCATSDLPVDGFVWTDINGNILSEETCIEVNPTDTLTVVLTATDANECSESDTLQVTNRQVDVAVDGDGMLSLCPTDSFQICVENQDVTDLLTYEWTVNANGTILSGSTTNCPFVTTEMNSIAIFSVIVTNQVGCTSEEQIEVETYDFDATTMDTVRVCPGIPTAINPNGNPNLIYNWTPSNTLDDPDSFNPVITTFTDVILTTEIMGINGTDTCMVTKEVVVLANPIINLRTNPQTLNLCEFEPVVLQAQSGQDVDFTWSENPDFSDPFSDEGVVTVNPEGEVVYYVLATDDLGCRDSATVEINAFPLDYDLVNEIDFCEENGTILIEVDNNDPLQNLTFNWSPSSAIVNNTQNSNPVEIDIDAPTMMFVEIENQFGCTNTDSVLVNYFNLDVLVGPATANPDTLLAFSGQTSQLNIELINGLFYEWSPAESLDDENAVDPIASPEETTLYEVLLTNDEGCFAQREVEVFVKETACEYPFVFVPSAFSPNDDGDNDVLFVRSLIIEELTFAVFNRWGQKVFETTDQSVGWAGTFKGEQLAPDVYGYYLTAKCVNGEEFFQKGNVSLLR